MKHNTQPMTAADYKEFKIPIKPLSVNDAWQGRRFKTDEYKKYEKTVLFLLPKITVDKGDLKVSIEYGFSSRASDADNPTKMILDILQKKYKFNDSQVYEIYLKKTIVPKGGEYFKVKIESI